MANADDIRSVFADWKAQELLAARIKLKESSDPISDPNDNYHVTYSATFEPDMLDKARIEIWVTDTGHVAVGIETYDRIVRRLGLRTIRHGFTSGHEPRAVSLAGLKMLFNNVALGKLAIVVKSAFRIAISAGIYMAKSDCEAMEHSGYSVSDWISSIPNDDCTGLSPTLGKSLSYRPW
jgi:hypothetical protein